MADLRVLLLLRALDVGGSERQAVTLAAGLKARGNGVGLLTFYPGGTLEHGLGQAGVELAAVGRAGPWGPAGFLVRLARKIRSYGPDVVYSFLPGANVVAAAAAPLSGAPPLVWGVRCADVDLSGTNLRTRLVYAAERRLSGLPRLIIANSRRGAEVIRAKNYPAGRIRIVPNGIDTGRFRFDGEGRARLRAEWGVGEADRLVGIAARLDEIKDHATFLRAASRLRDRPGLRFVCVGPGPAAKLDGLRRLSADLGLEGRVVWAGGRSDMPAVYSAFDLATLTSTSEGFPNGLAEAMACGVPCVSTDAGDARWLIGDTGQVVPVGQDGDLASAWTGMLDRDDLSALGQAARARIEAEFGVATLAERTESVLKAAAGRV